MTEKAPPEENTFEAERGQIRHVRKNEMVGTQLRQLKVAKPTTMWIDHVEQGEEDDKEDWNIAGSDFPIVPDGIVWSCCPCCDRIFVVLAPFETVTAPWSVHPSSYVDEDTTQVGGGKGLTVCLCKRSHEGERVTGHLSLNTLSTAHEYNGTWPTRKNAVRVPSHAGLCCKRGIAILSALRACESWSIAKTERGKSIFSRRNSIKTVMISVPLDVLKQYFGIFAKMGLQDVYKV